MCKREGKAQKETVVGDGWVHYVPCGSSHIVYTDVKTDPIVHFKFVHSRLFQVCLNKTAKER